MNSERGQATVEWIALLLLIALALAALSHLAPSADGRALGATLARSVTGPTHPAHATAPDPASLVPLRGAAPLVPLPGGVVPLRGPARAPARRPPLRLPELPPSLRRAGRGAGALWRRAWFACLVYERTRYALLHPESRIPGYTLPFGVALRMANNCISPVDLVRDWELLDGDR